MTTDFQWYLSDILLSSSDSELWQHTGIIGGVCKTIDSSVSLSERDLRCSLGIENYQKKSPDDNNLQPTKGPLDKRQGKLKGSNKVKQGEVKDKSRANDVLEFKIRK